MKAPGGWGWAHPAVPGLIGERFERLRRQPSATPAAGQPRGADPRAMRSWAGHGTPAFPVAWPPAGDATLVQYGFAQCHAVGHADAAWVSTPFVRVVVPASGEPAAEPLADALVDLGLQGVRPLSGSEIAVNRRGDAALAELRSALPYGKPPATSSVMVAFYLQWCRSFGILVGALRPGHRGFLVWLGAQALALTKEAARAEGKSLWIPRLLLVDDAGREHALDAALSSPPSETLIGAAPDATIRLAAGPDRLASVTFVREFWFSPAAAGATVNGTARSGSFALRDGMDVACGGVRLRVRTAR